MSSPPPRLTFADDAFLRRHRGLGSPVVNQFVWRFGSPLPPGTCEGFAAALARGAFGRRATRSSVPGARARWQRETGAPPVRRHEGLLDPADLTAWIADCVDRDLDPGAGPAWEVATVDLADGGCAVSMVVAHAVADGSAMVDAAVRAAAAGEPLAVPPGRGGPRLLVADVGDALGQVAVVGRWGLRAVARARRTPGRAAAASPPVTRPRVPLPAWAPSWLVAEVASADLQAVAEAHGGTTNAWFVAAVAGLVRRSGRALGADGVRVALPVSTREPDDPRGNATRIARVAVPVTALDDQDLAVVRAACKAAYAGLDDSSEPLPLALVQMLPDRVVGLLPPPPAAAALASNLGTTPPAMATLGGVTARSVTALAHQRGLEVAEASATGGGLLAFLVDAGERTTLAVAAVDPFRVADEAALRTLVTDELASWGLDAELW